MSEFMDSSTYSNSNELIRVENEEIVAHLPPDNLFLADLNLAILYHGTWQTRRVVYTKESICFARTGEETVKIDEIPLAEVESVEDARKARGRNQDQLEDAEHKRMFQNAVIIRTVPGGFNSGRTYHLQANSAVEASKLTLDLSALSRAARQKKLAYSRFRRIQKRVRSVYKSRPFQAVAMFLIVLNFCASISETQTIRQYNFQDPGVLRHVNWDMVNTVFSAIFAAELGINAFAHWFQPFFKDGWNVVDTIVVISSVASLGPNFLNQTVIRILRALRVVRLFGRVRQLKKVVSALTASIVPMVNAFIILFVLASIYAIIGVTLFGELDELEFGVFDRALITLVQITCGATWVTNLPVVTDNGSVDGRLTAYIISYVILSNWVILQISVAILLESFSKVSSAMEKEEERRKFDERKRDSPLDPLLERLTRKYTDEDDLRQRLKLMFQVMDQDGSGKLSSREFCAAIKKLDFNPPIHISDSDFVNLTLNGALCDENGLLGAKEFEHLLRQHMNAYIQSILCGMAENRTDEEFVQYGVLKMLLMQVIEVREDLQSLRGYAWGSEGSQPLRVRPSLMRSPSPPPMLRKPTLDDEEKAGQPQLFARGTISGPRRVSALSSASDRAAEVKKKGHPPPASLGDSKKNLGLFSLSGTQLSACQRQRGSASQPGHSVEFHSNVEVVPIADCGQADNLFDVVKEREADRGRTAAEFAQSAHDGKERPDTPEQVTMDTPVPQERNFASQGGLVLDGESENLVNRAVHKAVNECVLPELFRTRVALEALLKSQVGRADMVMIFDSLKQLLDHARFLTSARSPSPALRDTLGHVQKDCRSNDGHLAHAPNDDAAIAAEEYSATQEPHGRIPDQPAGAMALDSGGATPAWDGKRWLTPALSSATATSPSPLLEARQARWMARMARQAEVARVAAMAAGPARIGPPRNLGASGPQDVASIRGSWPPTSTDIHPTSYAPSTSSALNAAPPRSTRAPHIAPPHIASAAVERAPRALPAVSLASTDFGSLNQWVSTGHDAFMAETVLVPCGGGTAGFRSGGGGGPGSAAGAVAEVSRPWDAVGRGGRRTLGGTLPQADARALVAASSDDASGISEPPQSSRGLKRSGGHGCGRGTRDGMAGGRGVWDGRSDGGVVRRGEFSEVERRCAGARDPHDGVVPLAAPGTGRMLPPSRAPSRTWPAANDIVLAYIPRKAS